MPVLTNIRTLVTCRPDGGQGDVHAVHEGALVWEEETIIWIGPRVALPDQYRALEQVDAGGAIVLPGLVDCHTHLAFGGWRVDEFEQRALGKPYLQIAREGGGILRTVRETRAASEEELYVRSRTFLREMMTLGVTTVECKSGYGLTVEDELKLLRVYNRLRRDAPQTIVPTFLGAHVVPPEMRRSRWIDLILGDLLPAIASTRQADFCDVFVEEGAYTAEEARRILQAATALGLPPKLHVDQLGEGGGAALAAEVGAVSADHLEYAAPTGIRAMADAGVVAVNLPLASLYLKERPFPARWFIEAGVRVAVATDFNPGTAPSCHLPLAMTLACTTSGMTAAEVVKGATIYGAAALGQDGSVGSLEPGKRADFILVDAPSVSHWLYHFRGNAVRAVFAGGLRQPANEPEVLT